MTSDDYKLPKGALGMEEPYHSIGMKWIGYAKTQYDGNDITVAIWSAMREVMDSQEARIRELEQKLWLADEVQVPLLDQLAEMIGRVEEFEKDARRYRWLRDLPEGSQYEEIGNYPSGMWDSEIDTAMNNQCK